MGAVLLKRMTPVLSPTFAFRDVNHVLVGGQSLSAGTKGTPVVSTSQPYANVMFNTGVRAGGSGLTSFVPLVESENGTEGETLSSGMSSLVTKIAREDLCAAQPEGQQTHDMLVSCHGVPGAEYAAIKKGTTAYSNGLAQVTAGKAIAAGLGKSYVVRAVAIVHGEADARLGSLTYDESLVEWQSDYDADVRAITGQADRVPMLHTQYSVWPSQGGTSLVTLQQLATSIASGGKIVMVGPKYIFPYADALHLTAEGYRWMGEYYAKAYRRVVLEGLPWEPLRPISVVRSGKEIDVRFVVPVRPLVLDTVRVDNPGSYGFAVMDGVGASVAISKVAVTGPSTVRVTLSTTPSGTGHRLRYALGSGSTGGPFTGPRGCLRDSDDTVSRHGNLFNWCVHFDEPVTT